MYVKETLVECSAAAFSIYICLHEDDRRSLCDKVHYHITEIFNKYKTTCVHVQPHIKEITWAAICQNSNREILYIPLQRGT